MNSTLLKKEEKEEEEEEPAEENSERGAEDRRNIPLRKVVTAPHKKRKVVRSKQKAFRRFTNSVNQVSAAQTAKHKIDVDTDLEWEPYIWNTNKKNRK